MLRRQVSIHRFEAGLAELSRAVADEVCLLDAGEFAEIIDPSLVEAINRNFAGVVVASLFSKRQVRDSGVWLPIAVVGREIDEFPAAYAVA